MTAGDVDNHDIMLACQQTRSNGESIYIGQQGPQPLGTVAFEEILRRKGQRETETFFYVHSTTPIVPSVPSRLTMPTLQPSAACASLHACSTLPTPVPSLLGIWYPSPTLIAPLCLQSIFVQDGLLAPTRSGLHLSQALPLVLTLVSHAFM
ncbi:hypothetical protein D9758_009594 [Tetrapyrgos nigripes]|uniref:Uncharacterized protein n=1 Tax=Tetrapyrgos nigripes TaxID=182062 RepID=A0A8H5LMH8_9AGAR|nr:hypothetical protein D9758_009594 [Tetrapyrgos nigripes]